MKATELRIGNLMFCHDQDIPFQWTAEDFQETKSQARPIPLTEEWLVRFGLIKKYLENPFEDGGFDLKEDGSRWYYWADNGTFNLEIQPNGEIWFEIYSCYRHIQHVHSLQNLYFALTGEELILK